MSTTQKEGLTKWRHPSQGVQVHVPPISLWRRLSLLTILVSVPFAQYSAVHCWNAGDGNWGEKEPVVYRWAYDYSLPGAPTDFIPQTKP
ncbi:MAG: hypothetical protein C4295_12305 [Candidatus Fervidibacterota bacterium]